MVRKLDLDLLEGLDVPGTEGPHEEGEAAGRKFGWKWLIRKKLIIAAVLFIFFVVGVSLMMLPARNDLAYRLRDESLQK